MGKFSTFCNNVEKWFKKKKRKSCCYDFATSLKEKHFRKYKVYFRLCVHVPLPYTSIPE